MSSNFYHGLAVAGWILNITGSLFWKDAGTASFIGGSGLGLALICYLIIIVKNRQQQNEATSR